MTVETSKTSGDGLRLTRRFDAAPERVFAAWLDPGAVKQWLLSRPSKCPLRFEIQPGNGAVGLHAAGAR